MRPSVYARNPQRPPPGGLGSPGRAAAHWPPAAASMVLIPANDELIEYSGYVTLDVNDERAEFTRRYGLSDLQRYGFAASQSTGARVRFQTVGSVTIRLVYTRECSESCAVDLDRVTCYAGGRCRCQCEAKLLVDGVQRK